MISLHNLQKYCEIRTSQCLSKALSKSLQMPTHVAQRALGFARPQKQNKLASPSFTSFRFVLRSKVSTN